MMNNREAVDWLINLTADIGKSEHRDLWHYEQALSEIKEMFESQSEHTPKRTEPHSCDYIRREDAINVIEGIDSSFVKYIEQLPSADIPTKCIAKFTLSEEQLQECVDRTIVRCKDCKYASDSEYTHCQYVTWYQTKNDFCSRGERKDG